MSFDLHSSKWSHFKDWYYTYTVSSDYNDSKDYKNGKHHWGYASNTPSFSLGHHAEPDDCMGFSWINNVAIAIKYLVRFFKTRS